MTEPTKNNQQLGLTLAIALFLVLILLSVLLSEHGCYAQENTRTVQEKKEGKRTGPIPVTTR